MSVIRGEVSIPCALPMGRPGQLQRMRRASAPRLGGRIRAHGSRRCTCAYRELHGTGHVRGLQLAAKGDQSAWARGDRAVYEADARKAITRCKLSDQTQLQTSVGVVALKDTSHGCLLGRETVVCRPLRALGPVRIVRECVAHGRRRSTRCGQWHRLVLNLWPQWRPAPVAGECSKTAAEAETRL
jgi:hypothetical protein